MRLDHIILMTLLLRTSLTRVKEMQSKSQPGDYGGGVPPVPIPNTEVKSSRADGTVQSGE